MKDKYLKRIASIVTDKIQLEKITALFIEHENELNKNRADNEFFNNKSKQINKIATFNIDFITRNVVWSEEIYNILERSKDSFEHNLDTFKFFIHPEDEKRVTFEMQDCVLNNKPLSTQYKILLPDGEVKFVFSEGIVEYENGIPIRMVGLTQDINEKKLKENQFKIFQNIISNNHEAVIFLSMDRKIIYSNKAANSLFGYFGEEILGLNENKLNNHDKLFKKEIADVISKLGGWSGELTLIKSDQKKFQAWVTISLTRNDDFLPIGYSCNVLDLSERVYYESKLLEMQNFLNSIISTIPNPVFVKNKYHTWIVLNEAFCSFMGYKKSEMIGKSDYDFFSKEEADIIWYDDNKVLNTGEESLNEDQLIDANGRVKTLLTSKKIFTDEFGEKYIVGLISDITDLKENEKNLTFAKDKAEFATVAKSEFLANMSHEIRTPLNAILGFSELIKIETDPERLASHIDALFLSSKNLLNLINAVLDLSKIEAGKIELKLVPVYMLNTLSELKSILSLKAKEKSIILDFEIAETFPKIINIDETRFRQILLNIVDNAIKFTDQGYVKVKLNAIQSKSSTKKFDLILIVEDSGIGISLSEKEKIFEAFYQQADQDLGKFGGTGLGLTITKKLIQAMNGRIEVFANKGKGTSFLILIPGIEELIYIGEDKIEKVIQTPNLEKFSLLIADDEEYNRRIIKEFLREFNIEIYEAYNGEETIQLTKDLMPDIIIMDVRMPIIDGIAACKILKDDPNLKHIPIIISTAFVMTDTEKEMKLYCDSFLHKPIKKSELMDMIIFYLNPKKTILQNADE
jgi:PAS domain S-box-containing protein